jgi:GNAT superfamily N-acetyltransferase
VHEILEVQYEFIPVLIHFCKKYYDEKYRDGELRLDSITEHWQGMVASGNGVCFMQYSGGQPIGFLMGFKTYRPQSGQWRAAEDHWFVDEKYRGRGIFLLKRFEKWAIEQGCSEIVVGEDVGIAPKNLPEIYRKMGYSELTKVWVKKLPEMARG